MTSGSQLVTEADMKLRDFFKPKHLLLSLGIGIAFALFVSALTAASNESPFFYVFLRPGSLLASLAGYGGHDLQGFLLYIIIGNVLFYWASAFLFLWWLRIRWQARHGSTASGPANTGTTH